VFTRRLSLTLLAPTVLVSLVLVAACTFGVLYLNHLHVSVSDVLRENEASTRAALRLETEARSLVHMLSEPSPVAAKARIWAQFHTIENRLHDAEDLANLPDERLLVPQIGAGLAEFKSKLGLILPASGSPPPLSAEQVSEESKALAEMLKSRVLAPTLQLTSFNTAQIEQSARDNRAVVATLQLGLLAVGLGGPVIGLLLGYAVARGLSRSIYQLSVRMRDAAGRLNCELGSLTLEEKGDLPDLHRQMQGVIEEIERVVAQLQQREREVLRAEQLAAVGQVAAGVAHELRNPLTSVKMLVQTGLEGDSPAGLPPGDLAIMEHEIRRMEQCIQGFIDFARPPRSERRRAELVPVVRRALALVEGRGRRQKVTVQADLPGESLVLEIDPEQIHQVVVNLLLNALDALPRGGTIHVSVGRVPSVNGTANGHGAPRSAVEVRVEDTGPGIAPRIAERLFEPFVSSKETGLGLGLSICKRLVEAHGGSIRGESSPHGGALFAFTLPLEEAGTRVREPLAAST
jgi:signal transduction histidine kinase